MDSLITLSSRRFSAGVCPQLGGALAWFGLADDPGLDFVRPASARAWGARNVRLTSSYPLVPYSNRIGDGRFSFEGAAYALRPNAAISPHPLHGIGWLRAWVITAVAPQSVSLAITHFCRGRDDPEWPWTFTAAQTIALDDAGLRMTLTLTNQDRRPMPAGIGLHPFFPKTPKMQLQFESAAVWINDSRTLPKERVAVPPEWKFALRRPVGDLAVDNCFVEWSRDALLYWPEREWGLHLAATEEFSHLVVFTSPARASIAIEPVSHANNAVNLAAARGDTGLVVLAPGASLSGTLMMTPFPLESTDDASCRS
jgi:aldose 1-epimerase